MEGMGIWPVLVTLSVWLGTGSAAEQICPGSACARVAIITSYGHEVYLGIVLCARAVRGWALVWLVSALLRLSLLCARRVCLCRRLVLVIFFAALSVM
jgi:hypothetical protein